MRFLTKLMSFIFAALLAVCCTKVNEESSAVSPDVQSVSEFSNVIPLEDALNNLDELLVSLYGKTKASGVQFDRNNVTVFGGVNTKSGESLLPDTTAYIVNFNGESGFAVLAAQTGLSSDVYCVTESGSISSEKLMKSLAEIEDLIVIDEASFNEVFDYYDEDLDDESDDEDFEEFTDDEDFIASIVATAVYVEFQSYVSGIDSSNIDGCLSRFPISSDIGSSDGDSDSSDSEGGDSTYRDVSKIGPFLTTKWEQYSPFNDFRSDGAAAGCVAVATAQILAHNEYDTKTGRNFNWALLKSIRNNDNYDESISDMSAEGKKAVSDFLEFVGNKNNCNIKYTKGSYSCSTRAKATFKNFGYKSTSKLLGFTKNHKNKIIAQLTKGLPVYMEGSITTKEGHAWVIDGVYVRDELDPDTGAVVDTQNLFHINWGWKGKSDGYFIQGVFDTSQRVAQEENVDKNNSLEYYDFYRWYRIITYSK